MAKRKRELKQQAYTEEIFFPCLGCYEATQQKLRKDNILFRTHFLGSLFFEQITDEILVVLDDLMHVNIRKES